MQQKSAHPHAYTLQLLQLSLERLPPAFHADQRKTFADRLAYFAAHPDADYADIHQTIVELGKASWPHRKAYRAMYDRYGRASEESHLLRHLDKGVRKKYEAFIHAGGKLNYFGRLRSIEDLMRPSPYERYFTPEEKFAIEEALLAARDDAHIEINALITEQKKADYEALLKEFRKKEKQLDEKIESLRALAVIEAKWETEILDKVRTFEEGWSVVEREVDEYELDGELEYWRGTMQAFLNV